MQYLQDMDNFDARLAAEAVFEVMKRFGLDMSHRPGNQHWLGSHNRWTKDFATIHLGNNNMFINVTKKGYSLLSRATTDGYSAYSTSFEQFKKDMRHIMWHHGIREYIQGKKNPEYKKYRKYLS